MIFHVSYLIRKPAGLLPKNKSNPLMSII